jgi:uncharacterized protein (DUF1697 family)
MTTYIILLRGVTPSGKNKVPMAQLLFNLQDQAPPLQLDRLVA